MNDIVRFGVSLDRDLLDKFDTLIRNKRYTNRSEAIRDLIRQQLVTEEWKENREIAGAIMLMYDHHKRELLTKIMDTQHDFQTIIVSTQHIHLDHHNCLEIIAVKGSSDDVRTLADTLKALKGVKHSSLSMSSTGRDLT